MSTHSEQIDISFISARIVTFLLWTRAHSENFEIDYIKKSTFVS